MVRIWIKINIFGNDWDKKTYLVRIWIKINIFGNDWDENNHI
jgi:hypothetical protein